MRRKSGLWWAQATHVAGGIVQARGRGAWKPIEPVCAAPCSEILSLCLVLASLHTLLAFVLLLEHILVANNRLLKWLVRFIFAGIFPYHFRLFSCSDTVSTVVV